MLGSAWCPAEEKTSLTFNRTRLDDKFRSEGAAVGDFNNDGKLDISAGSVYYAAPDWRMVPVLEQPQEFDPHNYSDSFCNFADDVNGDGRTDLIVVGFPGKETWWYEQPATAAGAWQRHECTPITNNESPSYLDVDGDGKRELLLGYDPGKYVGYANPAAAGLWKLVPVSAENAPGTDRFSHGIGAGDVNNDGRTDVLVIQGWWEAPSEPSQSPWVFHPVNFGEACSQMYVYDFDGDGDNDVVSSSAPPGGHLVARTIARRLEDAHDLQGHLADAQPEPGRHERRRTARPGDRQALLGPRPHGRRESRRCRRWSCGSSCARRRPPEVDSPRDRRRQRRGNPVRSGRRQWRRPARRRNGQQKGAHYSNKCAIKASSALQQPSNAKP